MGEVTFCRSNFKTRLIYLEFTVVRTGVRAPSSATISITGSSSYSILTPKTRQKTVKGTIIFVSDLTFFGRTKNEQILSVIRIKKPRKNDCRCLLTNIRMRFPLSFAEWQAKTKSYILFLFLVKW